MDNANIFDEFDPGINPPAAQPAVPSPLPSDQSQNMFDEFDPDKQQSDDSGFSLGALTRSAVRSVLPAVAGFAAAGGGAEVGSEVGAGIGAGVGSLGAGAGAVPGAAIGGVAGGIIGGVGAGIVGSYAASTAQDYGLKALPDSWRDFLGQSEEQQQSDIKLHPLETFTGGLVPYLLTMSPFAGAAVLRSLPQNATAFQRIAANPVTGRLFSGAVMGGMELGNEAAQGQPPDWRNIAISTGFGVVFSRPNRLGERITEIGAAPARRFVGGAPAAVAGAEAPAEQPTAPEAAPAAQPNAPVTAKDWNEAILGQAPTVAQAADAKVMGPGITEDVFMGAHEQAPDAAMSAQDQVRAEAPAQPAPDLHATALAMHPELFGEYDNLAAQRDDLRAQIARLASPADEDIQSTEQARDALQEQLDAHLAARGGYAGGAEARGLRAKLRDAQSQFDDVIGRRDAFAAGEGTETPDMAALRQHLMATDFQMRDLAPQVAAAYRRAADFTSHPGIIEPEAPSQAPEAPIPTPEAPSQATEAPSGAGTAPSAPSAEPAKSIDAQVASIAQQVAAELVAAGRPADEARANGQLIAQRYRTRAARLNNALGGPEDLYRAEGPVIRGAGRPAPLMPTEAAPALPSRTIAQPQPAATTVPTTPPVAETAPSVVPEAAPVAPQPSPVAAPQQRPIPTSTHASEIEALDPRRIGVDAKRFQFKAGGDEAGVTERLQGVDKWDPRLAGTALVFRDADGKDWITDGHQRLALANRLIDAGQDNIHLNAFVLNAADGMTDAKARAIAAVKNIAEGTGSAVDTAKVLRAASESGIDLPPLPPRSTLVRDGKSLAQLSPEAFGIVVNDVVPPSQGAIVGRLVPDAADQVEALRLLARVKPENVRQAEMIVRDMIASGTEQMTRQDSLFGEEAFAGSVVLERAKIADEAIKQLRKDKATFRTLVKESDRIVGAGENVLDQEANTSRLTSDEKASDLLTHLAFRAGPVSDALSDIARRFKAGDISAAESAREFLGTLRRGIESGVDTGADAGQPVAGAAGERPLETEPGAEGLPQTLIPGVAPVTDAERIAAEAGKPLTGGDAAAGGLFDEDARNQQEMFQPAPPIDTPEFNRWFGKSRVVDEHGAPLVVYHSTNADFEAFDRARGGETTAENTDQDAARVMSELGFWTNESPLHEKLAQAKSLPLYVRIEHPYRTDFETLWGEASGYSNGKDFEEALKDRGYDGLSVDDTELGGTSYVAFDPTQIKSTANRGTFDPNDPRILFQPGYHGSPHIFDRFSSDKIGTGEGAQAYGHGLYFAGKKEVAAWYRKNLTNNATKFTRDGQDVPLSQVEHEIAAVSRKAGMPWASQVSALKVDLEGETIAANVTEGLRMGDSLADQRKFVRQSDWEPYQKAMWEAALNHAEAYTVTKNAGRLYHVDVPEPHELLDWDKPLSEQPEGVREKLQSVMAARDLPAPNDATGQQIYNAIAMDERRKGLSLRDGEQAASKALAEAGIPGHQYLDQASRNPQALADAKGSLSVWEAALRKNPDDAYIKDEVEARRADVAKLEAEISHNYVIYDDSRVAIKDYEQAKRASITFTAARKPIIKLFADADASSFLHETGHQWLEELMRDAVHPAANDALKDDAQTVRDWLGIGDIGETIKTRQHEKFARGFEQYMREGVAPSPGLARVFAQFKSWLVQIYQSLKGLGSPINDDIRGVFDRMLSEEPNRTVVTPEREAAPGIADIHATDAATIDPHEAEPAMDRVIAERDRYVSEQPPEVQNELATADAEQRAADAAANAGTEAGAVAGGSAEVATSGVEPQPQPAGGAGSSERGPIIGGGGTAGPEGNGISGGAGSTGGADTAAGLREQRSEPAGGPRTQPLSPEPTTLFGPEQSPFIDRAGNIRVENLTSDADVAQAIHDAADQNNDFIGDRRGVITDGQVIDLADALGMDARDLSRRQLGEAFNAEQIIAARKLLIQSATDVVAAMKKAATGSDADVLAYAQIKAKHQMIQGQVSGLTAEAGRALRAFRSLAGQEQAQGLDQFLRTATGKTLFQLKEEAKLGAQLDTPAKVSKFVRDGQKRTFGRMVLEYWINGLISGPATHTTYMVGNLILSLEKAGPETAAAALIGRLRNAMGREGETVRMGEVGAQLRGAVTSLPMATKAAIDSLRTGVTTRLPGETAKSMPFQQGAEFAPSAMLDETMSYAEVAPRVYGAIRGLRDGLISAGALVKAGGVPGSPLVSARFSPLGSIPDIAVRGVPVVPLGTAIRLPGRFVAAIHSFFRATNYSMAKNALAYRAASEAGLTGDAFDAKVADIRQNPTPQMMEDARATATNLTLMGQGSEFVQALGRLTNAKVLGFPLLKFIDPFVHIAGNILDQSIVQRTPLGLLAPEIRADLSGKNGNIAQDTASARMLVGTAITITFGSLAAQGLMSGSGPSDPQQAAMWRLAGNQAHSIRIGDVWYDVHRLGPMGMLGSMAADMYDVAHAASAGDFGEAAAGVLHAFTQTVLDEGFMSGPSELIQALEDPGRYGASYVRNQLASFVPYSVAMQQMDRASDPYSRQAKSIVDALKNKVPGLSETLTPRRDVWGNEIPNLPAFGGRMLSAILMQQVSNDPVNQAMLSLGIYPASVERKIRGVQLTDQQYDDYSRIAGRMTKQRLDTIVRSQAWGTWTPTVRHDVLLETIRQSRETARGIVMMKNPSIISAATQAKLAPFQEVTP